MDNIKINVLVVDDDPSVLSLMKSVLERKNCRVQCASTFEEALRLLVNEIFHIAFVECVLKSGQGTELASEGYKILGRSVEMILMSGIVSEESVSGFLDRGVSGFLSKPISEKEIDRRLSLIREKMAYGETKNLLVRLFSSNVSTLQKTKLLISLKNLKGLEFLFCLNQALHTKESLSISFTTRNKKHSILCFKGDIVHYENRRPESFKSRLLKRRLILESDAPGLIGKNQKQIEETLLTACLLSQAQLSEIKLDMLKEAFSGLTLDGNIEFAADLSPPAKEGFVLMSLGKYTNWALSLLKNLSERDLSLFVDGDVLGKHLVFQEEKEKSPLEEKGLLHDLKMGMKLGKACETQDLLPFWRDVFRLLLRGEALFSSSSRFGFVQLRERYRKLYEFSGRFSDPQDLFSYFLGNSAKKAKPSEIKQAWLYFTKHNHPDKFPFDLPPDILKTVNLTLSRIQGFYDKPFSVGVKSDEKEKQEKIQKEIFFSEKKKIYERYMEKGFYKKAFSVIDTVPEKTVEEDIQWQLFWLWLYFEDKSRGSVVFRKKSIQYMKNIQSKGNTLKREKMYYYTLGLYYESKQDWQSALNAFKVSKQLDPSFQSCYKAVSRCSLKAFELKRKKGLFSVLKSFNLQEFGKKAKKTG